MVKKEMQACLEHQVNPELPDRRDHEELVADPVSLDQQVKRVKLGRKVQLGYAVSLDDLDNLGSLDLQDLEVNKALVDQAEQPDHQAQVVLVERWVNRVHQVVQGRLDYVANKVKEDQLVKLVHQVNKDHKVLLGPLDHLALLGRKVKEEDEVKKACLVKEDYLDLKGHEVDRVRMDYRVAPVQQGQWVSQGKEVSQGVLVRWGRVVNQAL